MKKMSEILDERARLILVVSGLTLILVGNAFDYHILKINLAELLAHVGALLLIVGLLHWIFDTSIRRQLTQEIFESVVGAGRTSSSGIIDVNHNSREVTYEKIIKSAKRLIIGEHYSSRFFEDYAPHIRERLARGGETIALLLKPETSAARYLRESRSGHGAVSEQIRKIHEITNISDSGHNKASGATAGFHIKWHKRVLRYSFVMSDDLVWVRFFTNSEGYSLVPAVCVSRGTPLYEFFLTDVTRLLEQAEDAIN
jgi:hypothetical protein